MFTHSDRFPTGPALPDGTVTPRPWALDRMRAYPGGPPTEYARVELDPATQTARYLDAVDRPVMMPGHGTSTGTRPPTGTNLDSRNDSDTGNDGDQ